MSYSKSANKDERRMSGCEAVLNEMSKRWTPIQLKYGHLSLGLKTGDDSSRYLSISIPAQCAMSLQALKPLRLQTTKSRVLSGPETGRQALGRAIAGVVENRCGYTAFWEIIIRQQQLIFHILRRPNIQSPRFDEWDHIHLWDGSISGIHFHAGTTSTLKWIWVMKITFRSTPFWKRLQRNHPYWNTCRFTFNLRL